MTRIAESIGLGGALVAGLGLGVGSWIVAMELFVNGETRRRRIIGGAFAAWPIWAAAFMFGWTVTR